MGYIHGPCADIADKACEWIVRLTSGDMSGDELDTFRRWTSEISHAEIFRVELGKWRDLEALRQFFLPDGTFLDPDQS